MGPGDEDITGWMSATTEWLSCCHPERSEGSLQAEPIPRFARDDGLAPLLKKLPEQGGTLIGQHAADHFGLVIQPRVP